MKKFLAIAILLFSFVLLSAQSLIPRFGTNPMHQGNTGMDLTYYTVNYTDVTGADSLVVRANSFETIYNIALKDSVRLSNPVITPAHLGDNITIIGTSTTGTPLIKFSGTNWLTKGTVTLSTGHKAIMRFIFDGTKWVESFRNVY